MDTEFSRHTLESVKASMVEMAQLVDDITSKWGNLKEALRG